MKYYECVSESFTQLILSKILIYTKQNMRLFYERADSFKEQNKQLFLWVSHLISYSADSLKNND